ncbi:MAG: hypothetical protein JO112_09135 [Planctomycetes bacterium]|nr:hypothetical protein [Planctomycetota bacterium]
MNYRLVDQIANAVLYEGYILYPYRPSVKNRQRWTFGGLFPQSCSLAQDGSEPWRMQTECLVAGGPNTRLEIKVRFLHLLARIVGELTPPGSELPTVGEPPFRPVPALRIGDRLYQTWEEAVERKVALGYLEVMDRATQPRRTAFAFPPGREFELLPGPGGAFLGILVRQQHGVAGEVEVFAEPLEDGLFKVSVAVANLTPLEEALPRCREEAVLRALVSTHTILSVSGGEFVSLLDPPEPWRDRAAACRNVGTWPVLVGEEGTRDTMLSAPIILYDYPQVAPESPGDLFDATEIDEILTLRILTLTEEEKQAMAAVDDRARALLARTEALAREQLAGLHGTVRNLRPVPGGGLP